MSDSGETPESYIPQFAKEEVKERVDAGELDIDPDDPLLPSANKRIMRYLRRGQDNPEELEVYRRLKSDGVADAVRDAVASDDYVALAYLQGWKEPEAGEGQLIGLLMSYLGREAMMVYVSDETDSGKTHFLLLCCVVALDLCDYEAFVTNVPIQTVDGDDPDDHSDQHSGGMADVVIPAEWDRSGREPTLEWAADPDLVRVMLEWHEAAGLPLEQVVATTEEHARVVTEYVDGRVFIVADEYGTSGGGAKGDNPHEDRPTVQFAKGIRKHPWYASMAIGGHAATDIPKDMRGQIKLGVEKDSKRTAELYETATSSGFEDPVGDPFEVGGHRLDSYHDKIQPVWAFIGADDDEGDGEAENKEHIRRWAQAERDAGKTAEEIASDPDFPFSESWIYKNTDG